ncbi:hypothetical protein VSDG_07573 [Cytospora chrysosperma]|uniref:AB hydrolase-1 domain-containing protein n=1 Tax=Cytospora chrysosperma TaxID=252740 RepID=A0A423VM34_CYTCH|nr:hypothetical protein VSDG_07573 [Valsa sordida]
MYSKFWPKGGLPGVLHHYTESLVTFEYASSANTRQPHSFLFVGGLSDGLSSTSYTVDIVRALQHTEWSFFTLNVSSSYQACGLGHLDRDTDEIAQCIRYIQEYKAAKYGSAGGKVVLMGHSTGSQCVLHYLHRPNPHTSSPAFDPWLEHVERPVLDGAIMQAPVSDREALHYICDTGIGNIPASEVRAAYDKLIVMAKEAARRDEQTYDIILPVSLTSKLGYPPSIPLSARRFLSLASPESPQSPSEDDLFSSDLGDEVLAKTFGGIQSRGLLRHNLMILHSGADQSVPDSIDRKKLTSRWRNATDHNGKFQIWDQERSGEIPNASHALSNDDQAEPRKYLTEKVVEFLKELEKK